MPVAFGHIKKIFVDREKVNNNVWLVASSGVYLLKYENTAPEYEIVHHRFLKSVHSTPSY